MDDTTLEKKPSIDDLSKEEIQAYLADEYGYYPEKNSDTTKPNKAFWFALSGMVVALLLLTLWVYFRTKKS